MLNQKTQQKNAYQPTKAFLVSEIPLVTPDEVLTRLRRARETARNPSLIILDLRDTQLYQEGYVITAFSTNCCKKIMAKRAAGAWDDVFAKCDGCPARRTDMPCPNPPFSVELTNPSVVVYDQHGECLPHELSGDSPTYYFLAHLLNKGNLVYFMLGGFKAFQALRSQDFMDSGSPCSLSYQLPDCESNVPSRPSPSKLVAVKSPRRETLCSRPSTPNRSYHSPCYNGNSGLHLLKVVNRTVKDYPRTADKRVGQKDYQFPEDVLSASVSRILPYLYLGNARDSQNLELLRRLSITHIVNVTDSTPMPFVSTSTSPGFVYLHLPALDTFQQDMRPAFERAVEFINEARRSHGMVLVHCQAGVSRSVAVVMAYLMYTDRRLSVVGALDFVQRHRPVAEPNFHFMGQLQRFHDDLRRQALLPARQVMSTAPPPVNSDVIDSLFADLDFQFDECGRQGGNL